MPSDAQELDTDAVSKWCSAAIPGFRGPITAQKFDTGQSNPTYRLDTASSAYVLRRKPLGVLLKSAHAVDREFRVQRALAKSDVPVCQMHAYCADISVLGSEFYVMAYIDGRNFNDPRLPELSVPDRRALFHEMNRVLAAIHNVDLTTAGLQDFGPSGDYFERQLGRWTKQYRATQTESIPAMDALIDWLRTNLPADDGQRTLVHGDYRLDNMLFAHDQPSCLAVLDWELSTLGHPFADLAAVLMQWRRPPGNEGRGLAGLERAPLGLPEEDAFIERYCASRGLSGISHFEFYLAFSFFRMGAILQGVKKRALDGNASNPQKALALGAQVPDYATQGLEAALGQT